MNNLEGYGLSQNPFPLTPDYRVTNWAGRDEIKTRMRDVVLSVLATDTGLSEFVVMLGTYGAGKTHALRYFSTIINEVEKDAFKSIAIYVPKVQVAPKISFLSIYFQIMQELGLDFIKELSEELKVKVKAAADELGGELPRSEEKALLEEDQNFFVKQVLNSIPKEDRPIVSLLISYADGDDKVGKYLYEGKPVIPNTDFTQQINTDYMATKVLSCLFRAMTISIGEQEPVYNAVQLFIDEVEDIIEAKSAEQLAFWQSIRELFNRLPYRFALILAFSADTALLEAIIPIPVAERTSRQNIELQALDAEEAKEFLKSHLGNFRPDDYTGTQPFHPFTEDAIDYIFEQTVVLIPRKIFRKLRTVFERAVRREGLQPGEEIDGSLAEDIMISMGL